MNRLIAAAVVLLLSATARADMGTPGDRYVPVRITLTVDPPPPGVVLFIQDTGPLRRMTVTSPLVIESAADRGGAGFTIYAVPEVIVQSWPDGTMPHRDWFGRHDNPDCKTVGGGMAKGRVTFDDDRRIIEQEYRLVRAGDAMRLEKVSENEGSSAYRVALGLVCCFGIPAATLGLWSWFVGRLFRRVK